MSTDSRPIVRPARMQRAVASAALAAIATVLLVGAFAIGFWAGYIAANLEFTNPSLRWLPGADVS